MDRQRTLNDTNLNQIEREALADLRARLSNELPYVEDVILFGSAARGTADAESDIDLLVLKKYTVPYRQRHQITAALTDINDQYETNFSSLVVDRVEWEEGVMTVFPIKCEIERDGVIV